jgi:hypothetical protein
VLLGEKSRKLLEMRIVPAATRRVHIRQTSGKIFQSQFIKISSVWIVIPIRILILIRKIQSFMQVAKAAAPAMSRLPRSIRSMDG